ncbi:MAG TPA: cytochrome b N-terminal domain-containing protein [bacterium]|nr:cytochrome b N-terminal domain-containing protein [bacterium]
MKAWLIHRLGLEGLLEHGVKKQVPPNVGWIHTLGAAAAAIFLLQVVTGFSLTLHYVPSPDQAHAALTYLIERVPAGQFVRSLHVYGASAMVIAVFLHFLRVYFTHGYRAPREVTWWLGLLLFALVLGFGFTGYLLPWDQKAYWATVVGTNIAGDVPIVGPATKRLMVGSETLGALTMTRFFAIHVLLLPAIFIAVLGLHLYLVDHHGIRTEAQDPAIQPVPGAKPFFPNHVLKESITAVVAVLILCVLANLKPAELGPIANPSDTSFIPRPEWYFLPLFQLLKYFEGGQEVVATVIIPGLVALYLAALPFIDPGTSRARTQLVRGLGLAGAVGSLVLLTLGAMDKPVQPGHAPPQEVLAESPAGPGTIEELPVPKGTTAAEAATLDQPTSPELAAMPVWFTPANIEAGKAVYTASNCASCHQLDGEGTSYGPALDGVAGRRDPAWLLAHFRDPKSLVPDSTMPAFTGTREELEALTAFMLSLTP